MTQSDALAILKTGANVYLTGEPGSGKTYTLSAYIAWLKSHGIEPSITASTGIAATHVGGMTVHAWSGLGIIEELTPMDLDRITSKEHVVKRLQKARVLIIDEVSMLSANLLDMLDRVLSAARHDERPFGGIQVVFAGDFFQLPPIGKRGAAPSFAFGARAWQRANPIVCYLEEQHRQEDREFLDVLSAIRNRSFDHTHASRVLSREGDASELDNEVPQLFTHNVDVDRMNDERLAKLSDRSQVFVMQESGPAVLTESLKRGCLSPERLVLKEGAIVMATKNNPAVGYANGTLGTVIGFAREGNHPIIETRDGRTLTIAPVDWAVEENGKVRAKITQIPLRLAWAITVHKSQGMSMDAAAIDLSRVFEYGQGYVALSRVRTLAGLTLLGWNEQAAQVHPEVAREDDRFREESRVAEGAFAALAAQGELEILQQNFIRAMGGTLDALPVGERPAKRSTYDETLERLEEGMTLADIAKARSLTLGTIADHAQKLIESGRIERGALMPLLDPKLAHALPEIEEAFEKLGTEKLTPVHRRLKGKYSFDDLKIARLFVG